MNQNKILGRNSVSAVTPGRCYRCDQVRRTWYPVANSAKFFGSDCAAFALNTEPRCVRCCGSAPPISKQDGSLSTHSSPSSKKILAYIIINPPHTGNSTPVIKLDSSDAKKHTALAISSGRPIRAIGITLNQLSFIF